MLEDQPRHIGSRNGLTRCDPAAVSWLAAAYCKQMERKREERERAREIYVYIFECAHRPSFGAQWHYVRTRAELAAEAVDRKASQDHPYHLEVGSSDKIRRRRRRARCSRRSLPQEHKTSKSVDNGAGRKDSHEWGGMTLSTHSSDSNYSQQSAPAGVRPRLIHPHGGCCRARELRNIAAIFFLFGRRLDSFSIASCSKLHERPIASPLQYSTRTGQPGSRKFSACTLTALPM